VQPLLANGKNPPAPAVFLAYVMRAAERGSHDVIHIRAYSEASEMPDIFQAALGGIVGEEKHRDFLLQPCNLGSNARHSMRAAVDHAVKVKDNG
jgi:hypothetical protein